MDKPNIFKSSKFFMDTGDILHLLIKDLSGSGISIGLNSGVNDYVEDEEDIAVPIPPVNLVDKDGNIYTTITIGTQEWIVENYRTTTYADDTAIPNITLDAGWMADVTGAYCWYSNNITNKTAYGAVYNSYAVVNTHGFAYLEKAGVQEIGWHVPTRVDWQNLITYIGGTAIGGNKIKSIGITYWDSPNAGTDIYNLDARGAGYRDNTTGNFAELKQTSLLASTTTQAGQYFQTILEYAGGTIDIDGLNPPALGISIRLVRDSISTLTDYDGNVYTTITIGTQQWTVENLKVTSYPGGYSITHITDADDWASDTSGAYCWYNNDIAYKTPYGALYNWYAVNYVRPLAYLLRDGIQEVGWRVPTKTDFETLIAYLGGGLVAGGKLKEMGLTHWTTPNTGADNSSGFTAIGATGRSYDGSFGTLHSTAEFWASTSNDEGADNLQLLNSTALAQIPNSNFHPGFEVRLVRDI
jgi:uncharacterized protein (TIGR02145 family)